MTISSTLDRKSAIGLARGFLDAMAVMDFDAVIGRMAPDVVVEMPHGPNPAPLAGRDAVEESFRRDIPQFLKEIAFTIERETFDAEAQRVVLEYSSKGTRADDRPYGNRYVGTWDFRDGAIVTWREYYNPLKLA